MRSQCAKYLKGNATKLLLWSDASCLFTMLKLRMANQEILKHLKGFQALTMWFHVKVHCKKKKKKTLHINIGGVWSLVISSHN